MARYPRTKLSSPGQTNILDYNVSTIHELLEICLMQKYQSILILQRLNRFVVLFDWVQYVKKDLLVPKVPLELR